MTLFLASVSNLRDAGVVLDGGADVVDLKDPARGALGALEVADIAAIVAAIAGRRPVSAVTGDLPMEPDVVLAAASAVAGTGVDYVKVGLFPGEGTLSCIRALSGLARTVRLVGVMFADLGPDPALVAELARNGFCGAMLDTAGKGAGRLLDHMDIAALGAFVEDCRRHGLTAGLAGSLEPPDIPRLLLLDPDLLGFRRALCRGLERGGEIDPQAVAQVRALIPAEVPAEAAAGAPTVSLSERLASGFARDRRRESSDCVFIRDFVLPVHVGAYAHEHGKPQKVRFDVDVAVRRPPGRPEAMADVFSYDVVTDTIRLAAAAGHIDLLETLAEQIATRLLTLDRVLAATVRIEKVGRGPAGIGIEITRVRPAEVAGIRHLFPAVRAGDAKADG